MGNVAVMTKRSENFRIFDHRDGVRTVAEQAPALRQTRKNMRPVLEPGAANHSLRSMLRSEVLQCLHEFVLAETVCEPAFKRHMGLRRRDGVLIAEEIRNQRQISAAARRYGQRTPRNRSD